MRSEEAPQENNYLRYLDNTLNSELEKRINNARVLTAKLGNLLINKERKTIRDELYRLEGTKLTNTERERAIAYLINVTKRETSRINKNTITVLIMIKTTME